MLVLVSTIFLTQNSSQTKLFLKSSINDAKLCSDLVIIKDQL